jgi:[ribosomal protein S18]-alanine N-acetyltransferase
MPGYEIAPAAAHDADSIAMMSREHVEHGFRWRWTPRAVAEHIRDVACNVVVAREGTQVIGFAIMEYRDEEAHLVLFCVHPSRRRRGIGSALIGWLEKTAQVAGIEMIFLESRANNSEGLAFYRALGYRELVRMPRYYQGKEDAVRIGKDLSLQRAT